MTLEKFTKAFITIFVIFVITMLLSGCVTKKKLKESQELLRTRILDETEMKWTNSVQNLKAEINKSTISTTRDSRVVQKESTSTNENESTDVTVNIKAEDGKEKSATVGNTTVTSNGADISVKTTSTKSLSKESETLISELSQNITLLETSLKTVKNESEQRDYANLKRIEKLESQLETVTKETNKKGFSFWFITPLVLVLILYILYRFRNRFSAFNKLKGFFIPKK